MSGPPVHRVEMPTPYAVGPVNAYLVRAEPLTLVDAGINTPEAEAALRAGLGAAGVSLRDIEQVLITHAHPDHYGLVHLLQDAAAVTVRFPAKEIARVRDRQMLFNIGKLLVEAGMPLELLFQMDQQRKKGPRPGIRHDEVVPLHDGDRFGFTGDGDPFELTALHMPGHTGGHMVFHDPDTGILFAGDQLLPDVSPNPLLEPSLEEPAERRRSLREYLDSLEKMAGMYLTVAYPGHGAPIADPQALITRTIEHHLKRKITVAGHLTDVGKTPYEVAGELYPRVEGYDVFLSVSEVIAHLDLVVEDGAAVVEQRDGVTYYSAR